MSYRREDSGAWTGRLAADLRRALPEHEVFLDIVSIEAGVDFVDAMRQSVASCAAALVVIGPNWLKITDEGGRRRLDDPNDWVRLEVVESLQRENLRVIPVLFGGAKMPPTAKLPEPLKSLARRNAHEVSDKRWDYDVGTLVTTLREVLEAYRKAAEAFITPSGRAPGAIFRDMPEGPEVVVVPAGVYVMGATNEKHPDEGPCHEVRIAQPFAVGRFEITFEEWDVCLAAGGCGHRPRDGGWGRGRRPVINVSWSDAQGYVAWLSRVSGQRYRLPSEAEWEYAARGGTTTRYPWGDTPKAGQANAGPLAGLPFKDQPLRTMPVGSYDPNAFGLCDVIGNVREWVQDRYQGSYTGAPDDGRPWEPDRGSQRVLRGGCFSSSLRDCSVHRRYSAEPDVRNPNLGFRVARAL